jgi:hypothetical protein
LRAHEVAEGAQLFIVVGHGWLLSKRACAIWKQECVRHAPIERSSMVRRWCGAARDVLVGVSFVTERHALRRQCQFVAKQ